MFNRRCSGTGIFFCSHQSELLLLPGDDDMKMARTIEEFYKEAARRLPLKEMPELESCVYAGGNSLGVGDPVTNIILNAVGLLLHEEKGNHLPLLQARKGWYDTVFRSIFGLQAFMTVYFRYLSANEARRYLSLASHDLSLAVKLVDYDRFPSYWRGDGSLKIALRVAAVKSEHPAPDVLVQLMTVQYPALLLQPLVQKLSCGDLLTVADVFEMKEVLAFQWPQIASTPPVNLELCCRPNGTTCTKRGDGTLQISTYIEEGRFVAKVVIEPVTSDDHRSISDLVSVCCERKLDILLNNAISRPESLVFHDASPCAHIVALKMHLLDRIHAFYITALAKMPSTPRCLRALLMSGHCYGRMTPVANIIINSIWYDISFPPKQGTKDELPDGILDTSSMSRLGSRSLDGLFAMVQHLFPSQHEAWVHLNLVECAVPLTSFLRQHQYDVDFDCVAKAAKHPQHTAFGSFLRSVPPKMLKQLNSVIEGNDIICDALWDQLITELAELCFLIEPEKQKKVSSCCLSQLAVAHMPRKKSDFLDKLVLVRSKLNNVLREYCNQHPWEPSYQVDIICGVWESSSPHHRPSVYHANFLASKNAAEATDAIAPSCERTLFFAEFWESPFPEDVGSKPSICCPIYDYLFIGPGRCSFCEEAGSKIIHPPSGRHSGYIDGSIDLYSGAVRKVLDVGFEGLLDSDFIYVDPDRDVELVKIINDFRGYAYDDEPVRDWTQLLKPKCPVSRSWW